MPEKPVGSASFSQAELAPWGQHQVTTDAPICRPYGAADRLAAIGVSKPSSS
jgi:hypothetical protein